MISSNIRSIVVSTALLGFLLQANAAEGLTGYYYTNRTLSGSPALIRVDPQIGFDWMTSSPNPAIPADSFSVRWIGRITPTTSESYTFHLRGDDGIRLWIDGALVIDSWKNQSLTEYTAQLALTAGKSYEVRVEYYENTGYAAVQLLWSTPTIAKQLIPTSQFSTETDMKVGNGEGLRASIFKNINLEGSAVVSRVDSAIDFNWGSGSPASGVLSDNFSVRWQGEVASFFSEDVTFHFTADDGVRLWVDGILLIDQWKDQAPTEYSAVIPMTAGKRVPLRVEYYERGGGATAVLRWSSSHILKSTVPTTQLFSTTGLTAKVPSDSFVSPACIEGEHWTATGGTYSLNGTGDGAQGTATKLTDAVYFMNIPLSSKKADTEIILRNSSSTTTITAKTAWRTTDLLGKSFSSSRMVIRLDDSLLFTVGGASKQRVRIDADADGKWDFQGFAGDKFPFKYSKSGSFEVVAEQQSPGGWSNVGSMQVVCVQAPVFETPALAGSSRELDVYAHPSEAINDLAWTSADPSLSVSVKGPFADGTGMGNTLILNTLRRGTPVFVSRIGNALGPILSWAPVQEFTVNIPAMREAVIDEETGEGTTELVMTPFIEDVRFVMKMFAHSSTFPGGLKSISINTNDINPKTGRSYFNVEVDPETGERVGRAPVDIYVPPGEDMYCFNIQPFVQNPIPKLPSTVDTVAARDSSSSSKEKSGGMSQNVNGDGCVVTIGTLVLCVGEQGTLPITVQPAMKNGKTLPLSIVNGPTPKPKFTPEPASVNCAPGAPKEQNKEVTAVGAKDGVYDVNCGGKIYPKRITVIKSEGISVVPSTASLCVGDTETFKSYACVSGKAQLFDSNWSLAPNTFVEFQGGAPSYPTSQVTVKGKKAGKPTTLTAADPAGKLKSGTATIDVGEFTVDPLYLTLCPGDEGVVTLKHDPKGNVKINAGGSIGGKTKVIVKDGAKDVTNGTIEVGPEGKKLTIRFNPEYPSKQATASVTFSPSVPCPDKVVTLTDPGDSYIKPTKVEQCKDASGNKADFEAFTCGTDDKSKPVEVDWSIDNTDFTVSPAKGTKTTVTRKADKSGKVTVTAKKDGKVIGTAEYYVYSIKFTKAPKDTCVNETAQFEAVSDPSGKAVNYSTEGDAKGCTIDASGKFKAGTQTGTITVAATLDGLYDCKVTTQIKVHELKVTLSPETICNKVGETSKATATLDGSSASPSWTLTPSDGKVTISSDGTIKVVTAPAADTYTVTATDSSSSCKGTATLNLVSAQFQALKRCYGFHEGKNGGNPTQIVCVGETKTVKVVTTGKGDLYATSSDEGVVKVTEPAGGKIAAGSTVDLKLLGVKEGRAEINIRAGSATGHVCATLLVRVYNVRTVKIKAILPVGSNGKQADQTKFNLAEMESLINDIWEPQACIKFKFEGEIEICKLTVPLDDKVTDAQRAEMIKQCGKLPDGVERRMFLVKQLPVADGLAQTPGSTTWIPEDGASGGDVLGHELGHNFGLGHDTPIKHGQGDLMTGTHFGPVDCVIQLEDVDFVRK